MKGVEWGLLYNAYKDAELDPDALEAQITRLMADDDVGNKKGVYSYVLNGDERALNIRAFSDTQKRCKQYNKLYQSSPTKVYRFSPVNVPPLATKCTTVIYCKQ